MARRTDTVPPGRTPGVDPTTDRRRRVRILGVALTVAAIVVVGVVAVGAFKPDPTESVADITSVDAIASAVDRATGER